MRTILHVDMDAFYASVEQRDDPALRGKPVIVGGRSRRGVVLAASYEVRPFGVRSAMPMAEALRKAPHAIVVPPHRDRYEKASEDAFAIFHRYTPLVEPLSLDEAFLDVTASRSLFGDGETIARSIKRDIREELGLTASAGVAPCKFAAKVASDLRKPDGLVVVPEGGIAEFLAPLPIERMWGVGPKTSPKMRDLGYATIGDLTRAPTETLERVLGVWGIEVARLARGDDERDVVPDAQAKSIGAEETYEEDLVGADAIAPTLLDHAARVARRLVRAGLSARTVVVKIKYADFSLRTRRTTLSEPVQDTDAIHRAAVEMLDRIPLQGRRVRLTGVSVSGIHDGPPPPALFRDESAEKRRRVEEVAKRIADRFGDEGAVTRATLLGKPRPVG
ncbi:MAG TPA: DNA polymerase IV [Polyangiaceae bacterium]|nr:DNA polymerase IV [Polyangiaceae bacterium]